MIGYHIKLTQLNSASKNYVYQIFINSPLNYKDTLPDLSLFHNKRLYIHSKFIGNLINNDEKKINSIKNELKYYTGDIGYKILGGTILHLYRKSDRKTDCRDIVKIIKDNFNSEHLYIENPDNSKFIGSRFDELVFLSKTRVNFCIDTAHLFVTNYKINTSTGMINYFSNFVSLVGIDRLKLIHLNSTKGSLGSNHKTHCSIFNCEQKAISENGLKLLIFLSKKFNIDIILERGKNIDIEEIEKIESIYNKDDNYSNIENRFILSLIKKYYKIYFSNTFNYKYLEMVNLISTCSTVSSIENNLSKVFEDREELILHKRNIMLIKTEFKDFFEYDKVNMDPVSHEFTRLEVTEFINSIKEDFNVVGSYARNAEILTDLDIVVKSSSIDNILDQLNFYIKRNGFEIKEIFVPWKNKVLKIDIFIYDKVEPEQLIIYTLTKEKNIAYRRLAQSKGWTLNFEGLFDEKGKFIKFNTAEQLKRKLKEK